MYHSLIVILWNCFKKGNIQQVNTTFNKERKTPGKLAESTLILLLKTIYYLSIKIELDQFLVTQIQNI